MYCMCGEVFKKRLFDLPTAHDQWPHSRFYLSTHVVSSYITSTQTSFTLLLTILLTPRPQTHTPNSQTPKQTQKPRIRRRREKHQRHDHQRRVQHVFIFVRLTEDFEFGVPGFLHDFFVERVAGFEPDGAVRAGEGAFVC